MALCLAKWPRLNRRSRESPAAYDAGDLYPVDTLCRTSRPEFSIEMLGKWRGCAREKVRQQCASVLPRLTTHHGIHSVNLPWEDFENY